MEGLEKSRLLINDEEDDSTFNSNAVNVSHTSVFSLGQRYLTTIVVALSFFLAANIAFTAYYTHAKSHIAIADTESPYGASSKLKD